MGQLIRIVKKYVKAHEETVPITRYLYFSVANIPDNLYEDPDILAMPAFAMLHTHLGNIDATVAKNALSSASWKSTDFFVNHYHPGALMSLARPFSRTIYEAHNEWFLRKLVTRSELQQENHSASVIGLIQDPTEGIDPNMVRYQFIPEYPPLKYLGFLSLEYSAIYEETMRAHFEQLISTSGRGAVGRAAGLFSGDYLSVSRNMHRFHRVRNFENLRLPVVRDFVTDLIDSKRQGFMVEAISSMSANIMTGMQFVIAFVGFWLAVLGLVGLENWLCAQKDIVCVMEQKKNPQEGKP